MEKNRSTNWRRPSPTPKKGIPTFRVRKGINIRQPKTSSRVRSREAYARACNVIPGGVNSPARAFGAVGGQPVFIARGEGPYLFDVDGNQYLDYVGSWGPLILGHAHPRVLHAVEEALRRGASFGAATELETQLAEMIIAAVPS